MAIIRNKLNQRLIINLGTGENIDLLSKGRVKVSEKALSSPHLQTLVAHGDVAVVEEPSMVTGARDSGRAGTKARKGRG